MCCFLKYATFFFISLTLFIFSGTRVIYQPRDYTYLFCIYDYSRNKKLFVWICAFQGEIINFQIFACAKVEFLFQTQGSIRRRLFVIIINPGQDAMYLRVKPDRSHIWKTKMKKMQCLLGKPHATRVIYRYIYCRLTAIGRLLFTSFVQIGLSGSSESDLCDADLSIRVAQSPPRHVNYASWSQIRRANGICQMSSAPSITEHRSNAPVSTSRFEPHALQIVFGKKKVGEVKRNERRRQRAPCQSVQ